MKGGKLPLGAKGYTIVEVMVVLAVSGVMFLIAASFVSGKQAKTAFNQGVNTLTSDIQSSIESVVDGQYSDIPLKCSVSGVSPRQLSFAPPAGTVQGSNIACTYLGQLTAFDPSTNTYYQYVIAAARNTAAGDTVSKLSDSAATAVTSGHSAGKVDLTRTFTVPQGLDVTKVNQFDASGVLTRYRNVGFVQGLGTNNAGATATMVTNSGSIATLSQASLLPVAKTYICLSDGTRNATIVIGANGDQLKATAQIGAAAVSCS